MRKLFVRASFAASMLLAFCQFAVAQGLTTDFEKHPLITKPTSAQPEGLTTSESHGVQVNNGGQNRSDEAGLGAKDGTSLDNGDKGKLAGSVYPGNDTKLNGVPVYVSALIKSGDRVQTGEAIGTLTVGTVSLVLGLNTTVVIQEALILKCGVVFVQSGTIAINNGKDTFSFKTGQTAYSASTSCEVGLPDSPGTVRTQEDRLSPSYKRPGSPATATRGLYFDARVTDLSFIAVNGVMFGSSIATAELTQRCLSSGACTDVPDAFRSRAAMYAAGMPAAAGVVYLGYYLKRKEYRWWFVPAALVTLGNLVVSTHAAHYSH